MSENIIIDPEFKALHPEEIQVGKVCPPESVTGYKQPPPQEKGFAASTAAVSGESKRSINQHLARAEAIGDDLERVTGTSLDKGVELDALAKLPEPERKELIDRAEAGEKVSARDKPYVEENAALVFAEELRALLTRMRGRFKYFSDEAMAQRISADAQELTPEQDEGYFAAVHAFDAFIAQTESAVTE